jgi:hypothetical protein
MLMMMKIIHSHIRTHTHTDGEGHVEARMKKKTEDRLFIIPLKWTNDEVRANKVERSLMTTEKVEWKTFFPHSSAFIMYLFIYINYAWRCKEENEKKKPKKILPFLLFPTYLFAVFLLLNINFTFVHYVKNADDEESERMLEKEEEKERGWVIIYFLFFLPLQQRIHTFLNAFGKKKCKQLFRLRFCLFACLFVCLFRSRRR